MNPQWLERSEINLGLERAAGLGKGLRKSQASARAPRRKHSTVKDDGFTDGGS